MFDRVLHAAPLIALVLLLSIPYVARIRHAGQKPLAAYLIFIVTFLSAFLVLFIGIARLLQALGAARLLDSGGAAVVYTLLVLFASLALGTWQARKPPMRRRPP